ncbi:MAG: hypothetical protein DHS20C06_10410 [Hyphobacterium sp.]|nr:MAG: hypothetical protein DHS20C06_10410 [Hyphobacterium sp.]
MAFIIEAMDRIGSGEIRQSHRAAHLAFLEKAGADVLLAGPVLTDDGEMAGSLFIVNYDSIGAVRNWLKDDPYSCANLFETVAIKPFKPVITNFER